MKKTQEKIIGHLIKEVEIHFSDELVFAVLFGSWARFENRADSDLDLMIVLRNPNTDLKKINSFKESFIKFQLENNLIPDKMYPGEYVSIFNIQKAIDGYGFITENEKVEIPPIDQNGWTSFNEYRQWLSALAGPNIFLFGDKGKFEDLKRRALSSAILIAILSEQNNILSQDEILKKLLGGGKEYLGFCDTSYTHKYIDRQLPIVLETLLAKKIIQSSGAEKSLVLNRKNALQMLPRLTEKNEMEFKKKFLGAASTETEKQILRECLEIGVDFVSNNKRRVLDYFPEDQLRARFTDPIPTEGKNLNEIVGEFKDKILSGSIRQFSQNYLAFPDSGNAISALAAEILIAFTNQNLIATTKSAPTATFAEMQVIQWLRQLIGFEGAADLPASALSVGGMITPGGTLANATALLVARCKAFPNSRKQGLYTSQIQPILIIAADTLYHYSHIASFWWLGLGEENIVFVKALDDFRLDSTDLDKKLSKYNNGKTSKVIAVVAQAGDSRTTTIEDFKKIVTITKKHNVWLHVDACHGGVLLFSKKHRQSMEGIEEAHSISIDPHKGLGIPYPSSAVLFRDADDCELISKSTDITIQKGSSDLGQITPFFGSRPFDSLKLWFLIKHLGTEGIGALVEYRYELAQKWADSIKSSRFFESLNEVKLNSVVFSVSPKKIQKWHLNLLSDQEVIGKINKLIHDSVYQEGYLCIHNFDIVDMAKKIVPEKSKLRVLGVTFGNPYTTAADFPEYIAYLDQKAEEAIKLL